MACKMATTEWVEIIEPRTKEHMFANLTTGECVWDPPVGVPVKKTDDNQWWELFDQNTLRFYYYNAANQKTVWNKPKGCDIIPLAKLQTLKQNTEPRDTTPKQMASIGVDTSPPPLSPLSPLSPTSLFPTKTKILAETSMQTSPQHTKVRRHRDSRGRANSSVHSSTCPLASHNKSKSKSETASGGYSSSRGQTGSRQSMAETSRQSTAEGSRQSTVDTSDRVSIGSVSDKSSVSISSTSLAGGAKLSGGGGGKRNSVGQTSLQSTDRHHPVDRQTGVGDRLSLDGGHHSGYNNGGVKYHREAGQGRDQGHYGRGLGGPQYGSSRFPSSPGGYGYSVPLSKQRSLEGDNFRLVQAPPVGAGQDGSLSRSISFMVRNDARKKNGEEAGRRIDEAGAEPRWRAENADPARRSVESTPQSNRRGYPVQSADPPDLHRRDSRHSRNSSISSIGNLLSGFSSTVPGLKGHASIDGFPTPMINRRTGGSSNLPESRRGGTIQTSESEDSTNSPRKDRRKRADPVDSGLSTLTDPDIPRSSQNVNQGPNRKPERSLTSLSFQVKKWKNRAGKHKPREEEELPDPGPSSSKPSTSSSFLSKPSSSSSLSNPGPSSFLSKPSSSLSNPGPSFLSKPSSSSSLLSKPSPITPKPSLSKLNHQAGSTAVLAKPTKPNLSLKPNHTYYQKHKHNSNESSAKMSPLQQYILEQAKLSGYRFGDKLSSFKRDSFVDSENDSHKTGDDSDAFADDEAPSSDGYEMGHERDDISLVSTVSSVGEDDAYLTEPTYNNLDPVWTQHHGWSLDNPLDIDAFSEEFDLRMRFGRVIPGSSSSTIPRPAHSLVMPIPIPPSLPLRPGSVAQLPRDQVDGRLELMSSSQLSENTSGSTLSVSASIHSTLSAGTLADFENFAASNLNIQKKGIFRKKMSLKDVLSWQSEAISKPLTFVTDKAMKKEAANVFKLVQIYMSDRKAKLGMTINSVAMDIAEAGFIHSTLRDEIYIQLCKQTSENPRRESLRRGWELLAICLAFFPPSETFFPYLLGFIQKHRDPSMDPPEIGRWVHLQISHYAGICYKRLERIGVGGRLKPKKPSLEDIDQSRLQIFRPSMFGGTLEEVLDIQKDKFPTRRLPWILTTLTDQILGLNGLSTEGIFRIPPDFDEVASSKCRYDQWEVSSSSDAHVPAALLKLWLRELYVPLIPDDYLYGEAILVGEDPAAALAVVQKLPDLHALVLKYLIRFLQVFVRPDVVVVTKMDASNLSMVFAPNFLRCPSSDPLVIMDNNRKEMAFVKTLIHSLDTESIKGVL